MNIKRIIFWASFIIVLGLIVWGLAVAMNKEVPKGGVLGQPKEIVDTDNVKGPKDAKVTLIEYSDFQCPACASYYPIVERLINDLSTSTPIRFVYRHFPLPQHQNAMMASSIAESAGKQGRFWEAHKALFDTQGEWQFKPSDEAKQIMLNELYKNIDANKDSNLANFDKEKFLKDLDSAEIKDKIRADLKDGINVGINSTPTFFINNKAITNPTSYAEFKKLLEEANK